ncbi:hypothetical protein C8J56DRAFT_1166366 [Mycena floridula]|nr:hypothetical protein C8J56DRAFT_1166366 [Mycena floridula]
MTSYPRTLNYAIHLTIFLLNLGVVGAMVWDSTPETRIKILSQRRVPPASIPLIACAFATLYSLTVVLLSSFSVKIRPLIRIVADTVLLIPVYIICIITLGIMNNWSFRTGTCTDPSWTAAMCAARWRTIAMIQTVSFSFCFLALTLTVVDLCISIKLRRRLREEAKELDDEASDLDRPFVIVRRP